MTNEKIIISNLNKTSFLKEHILRDINLEINQRSIFGLLGHESSGKSELLEILAMKEKPSSGEIKVFGYDYAIEKDVIINKISFCSTSYILYRSLTFMENVEIYNQKFEVINEIKNKLIKIITEVGGTDIINITVAELSVSLKRIINLALSILKNKDLLLIDRPTFDVEEIHRHIIWKMIKDYQSTGKTIIFSTDSIDEAEELAGDNYVIIDRGIIIAR